MRRNILTYILCMLLLPLAEVQAQSLKDLLNSGSIDKVVSTITGANAAIDLVGNWSYNGSAIELESNSLLLKAGSSVASSTAEKRLNQELQKIGIRPGKMTFTFNDDSSFYATVGKKKFSGSYTYDTENQQIKLTFAHLLNVNAQVKKTSKGMNMLFDSDMLLKVITYLSSVSQNSTLKAVSTLTKQYDGMQTGFSLQKK